MSIAESYLEGKILLFDKPLNWTSFDVVKKVKAKLYHNHGLRKLKVGHAGTLDPLASGLMLVCTGRATKKIQELQDQKKEYTARIGLGKTTPSFDLETPFDGEYPFEHINEEMVLNVLQGFEGVQWQLPPVYSAKRLDGKRAYELAREKKNVEMQPAKVEINHIALWAFELPFIEIKVVCSKGTYVRSLAHDIGARLKSGAYLAGLQRTAIGAYRLSEALDIEGFEG
jgi:tRNA pseudouridine55 synthase